MESSRGVPSGRHKNPRKGTIKGGEKCALVIGKRSNYWITVKQARHKLRSRLAVVVGSNPLILQEFRPSRSTKDDLIIEKVYSALVCRKMREHRDELIHQISKARFGKPRRAYKKQPDLFEGYIPLPYGFGLDDKHQN